MRGLVEGDAALQLLFADVAPGADVVGGDGYVEVCHFEEVGGRDVGRWLQKCWSEWHGFWVFRCSKVEAVVDYQSFSPCSFILAEEPWAVRQLADGYYAVRGCSGRKGRGAFLRDLGRFASWPEEG